MTMQAHTGGERLDKLLRMAAWGGAVVLLLVPAVAMRFTQEVVWDGFDFAVIGAMLLAACGLFELIVRASRDWAYRMGGFVAVGTAFLLVWATLAVGFIGDEGNPANLMYGGVLAIALLGALFARGGARGLAPALAATAGAQATVAVIAPLAGLGYAPLIPTTVFVALWLTSAWLFRLAARRETATSAV